MLTSTGISTFTVSIDLPEELKNLGVTPESVRREAPVLLVLKRFREGAISSGKGAEILGITRREFIEILGREKIPLSDLNEEEIEQEFGTAQRLMPPGNESRR